MVYVIIRKSEREIRERIAEAPAAYRRAGITGYARDVEEAERIQRERGYDNREAAGGGILCDDGGKAHNELMSRTFRAAGKSWEEYQDGK